MGRERRTSKGSREIPWSRVRQDYVAGGATSLRALAIKYGLDRSNLQRRARKELWDQQRARFQEELLAKTCEAVADAAAAAFRASFVDAIEDTEKVRRRATQVLLELMDAPADLLPEEERVTLTKKAEDGTTIRKDTRKKRVRPDARWVAEFLRSHTELLSIVVKLRPESGDMRVIDVD